MITPVNGWVLVRPIEENNTTASGLYISSSATLMKQGIVISTSDTSEEKCPVFPTDKIFFHKGSGLEVKENNETYLVLKFDAIIGKMS